jgi:hypothetical protein
MFCCMCRWRSRLLSPEYPQSSKAERTGPAAAPAGGCSHVRTSLPPAGRQACRETAAPLDNWTRTASAPPDLDRLSSPFVRRDRATARGIFGTSQRTRREEEVGFTFPFPFPPCPFRAATAKFFFRAQLARAARVGVVLSIFSSSSRQEAGSLILCELVLLIGWVALIGFLLSDSQGCRLSV